jgi:hypothetical protein
MIKIFRVPTTSPLLFQSSLSEYDLTQILEFRITNHNRRRTSHRPADGDGHGAQKAVDVAPKPLEDDECWYGLDQYPHACPFLIQDFSVFSLPSPICQEEMTAQENLTYCHRGCGNHIHVQCMEVWGKNSSENHSGNHVPIKCPLCRTSWGVSTLDELRVLLGLKKATSGKRAPVLCSCCQQVITATRYRCLVCPVYDSCGVCYRCPPHCTCHDL